MKNCPYCAEEVQDDDIICRHCLRDLWPASRRVGSTPRNLISAIEYVLNWLKQNDPELYKGIVAKLVEQRENSLR